MSMQRWFPVRCCCVPKKVVGFIRLPDSTREGRVRLVDAGGRDHEIEMKTFSEMKLPLPTHFPIEPTLAMRAAPLYELAVYSDDRPAEWWRRFDHFIPAGDA